MAIRLSSRIGEPKWIRMSERTRNLSGSAGLERQCGFYSATVYYSIGIPHQAVYRHFFSIARCSGWVAQVLEQMEG